jgi:hypothetical protein
MVVVNVISCEEGVVEYKPFTMHMWVDQNACDVVNANIITLFDIRIFLSFHCLLPVLELLNGLIKMINARGITTSSMLECGNKIRH